MTTLLRTGVALVALAACYALLAQQALTGSLAGGLLAVALVALVELGTSRLHPGLFSALDAVLVGRPLRSIVRDALLALLLLLSPEVSDGAGLAAATGLALLQVGRTLAAATADLVRRRRARRVLWRNLPVPELDTPLLTPVATWLTSNAVQSVQALDLVVVAGAALLLAGAPAQVLVGATVVAVLGVLVVLGLLGRAALALRSAPSQDEAAAAVRAAVERHGPRVTAYFGGPPSSTHALNVWLPTLERLDVPTMVIVRDAVHLRRMASDVVPVVYLPRATDVEEFAVPSLALALYPTNIAVNNHLLRVPGVFDVFVGHGDSDKAGSFTPLSRIYDEVWVAGPAGRDRYRTAAVGVRDEQVREVGRPQLVEIERARPAATGDAALFTVLYAPTWEGFYGSTGYSSLTRLGPRLVRALLAQEGVRVLFKPHPASGSVDRSYAVAARAITDMVQQAGAPHAVVPDLTGLYEAFNASDLLVSDVSSVVTDFLHSRKPYVMTNPDELSEQEYRAQFPSSGAACLWGPELSTLTADLAEARTVDRRRPQREALAAYLLGSDEGDPTERFHRAVYDVLARADAVARRSA